MASAYTHQALQDQVVQLPGTESFSVPFKQFSGYLNVSPTKNIHYWFVESIGDPKNDPILFWTNGGPGCSGLVGFFWELGPFKPNADLSLSFNKYTWNQVANILFVEAPCGVGFSYSTSEYPYSTDYYIGDDQTAEDNYILLQQFYLRFPQYASNGLYLTSESYGGHYIPTLAKVISSQNKISTNTKMNLKGFAIGNPYTNLYSGSQSMYETFWAHQLISKPLWDQYQQKCAPNFNSNGCQQVLNKMDAEVGERNYYGLDYPICKQDYNLKAGTREQGLWLLHYQRLNRQRALDREQLTNGDISNTFITPSRSMRYDPCIDDHTRQYLNQPSVKSAIHVHNDINWVKCSDELNYKYEDMDISMVPLYNQLITDNPSLQILIYSGDDDSVCSTLGTQSWIWDLGHSPNQPPWQAYYVNGQPSGSLTNWKGVNLAFLTIHGAGHEVPLYKPDVGLQMITDFLSGKLTNP